MKKLLYLIPCALILLSLTPFALYKDTVTYGSSLDSLSPGHWKPINIQFSASGGLDSFQQINPGDPIPKPDPVSKDASFKGFPFGAYFSRSEASSNSSYSASGYSWLWGSLDALLIIAALTVAVRLNRRRV